MRNKTPREFASKVLICSVDGRALFHLHKEAAQLLCTQGYAEVDSCGRRVWRILLKRATPKVEGPSTSPKPRDYGTAPTIFREVLSYREQRLSTYTLKSISEEDWVRIMVEHLIPVLGPIALPKRYLSPGLG